MLMIGQGTGASVIREIRAYAARQNTTAVAIGRYRLGIYSGKCWRSTEPQVLRFAGHWIIPSELIGCWRSVGYADKLARIDHQGWYADDDSGCLNGTYRGQVWRLPSRRRTKAFAGQWCTPTVLHVAGFIEPNTGCVILDASRGKLRTFELARDAALAADELARIHAERDREFRTIADAECQAEGRMHLSADEAREAIAALREQRAIGPVAPRICAMLRADIASARQRMCKAISELRDAREMMAQYEQRTARVYARIIVGRPIFGSNAS